MEAFEDKFVLATEIAGFGLNFWKKRRPKDLHFGLSIGSIHEPKTTQVWTSGICNRKTLFGEETQRIFFTVNIF